MTKSNLILNNEWGIFFQNLPDEQAGMLIKALYQCHEGKDVSVDLSILAAFAMMSSVVCENAKKYEEKCRKNSENRSKAKTTVNDRQQPSINEIKGNEKKENLKEKSTLTSAKRERFTPPSAEEVQEYCDERQNGISGAEFVDFYTSKGWKIGKEPMKDWKAAVRTWERKRKEARSSPRKTFQNFPGRSGGDKEQNDELKRRLLELQGA